MNTRSILFTLLVAGTLVLAACGGAAATQAPVEEYFIEPGQPASKIVEGAAIPQSSDAFLLPVPTMAPAFEIVNSSGDLTVIERANRMIVKNADVRLMVKDTDVAIDRATQIVGDAGGYIVSSRVWYRDYYGSSLKYASITIGVPVDEFERVLTRLRGLAVRVVDETASGDDVTDQYVDLQSQLTNLEATRERVKSFLDDAKTVDEALRINQELASLESQIEQIKGRMNYLSDRSAFSTITINLEPELPEIPAPEPQAWNPGAVLKEALKVLTAAYQGIANFLIWVFVVILPIVLPPALILWAMWKLLNRKPGKPVSGD
jgi:hypothetical protein